MKNPTYYNGVICPFENASIPLFDRSIFFADAVYDVMIGRNKIPYQFSEHIDRLRNNCKAIGLRFPYTDTEISDIVNELLCLFEGREFMIYVQVSGHSEKRAHKRGFSVGNILLTVGEIAVPNIPNTVSAILVPDMRYGYCNIKTTNLLPSVLSVQEASKRGADIAIFHKEEKITEASYANVFVIKNGVLITPRLSNSLLPGITRENISNASHRLGIKCNEDDIYVKDLLEADAVLFSSTTKLIQVCAKIDGKFAKTTESPEIKMIFNELYADYLRYTE